jgi:hypothetical protein
MALLPHVIKIAMRLLANFLVARCIFVVAAFNAIHISLRFSPQICGPFAVAFTCDLVSTSPLEDGPAWAEGLVCHDRSRDRSDMQDRGSEISQSTLRSTHVEMISDDQPCDCPVRHFVSSLSPVRLYYVPTAAATPDHPDSEVADVRSSQLSPDYELATFSHISDHPSRSPNVR